MQKNKELDVTGASRRDLLVEGIREAGYKNISQFCKKNNLDYAAIYRYTHGKLRMGNEVARKLELILGKVSGYLDQHIPSISSIFIPIISHCLPTCSLVDVLVNPLGYTGIDLTTIKQHQWDAKSIFVIVLKDTSMEPVIRENSDVFIDTSQKEITNNKIYAIRINQTILIRKIYYSPLNNLLSLISFNEEFLTEIVDRDNLSVEIIGRAIYLKMPFETLE